MLPNYDYSAAVPAGRAQKSSRGDDQPEERITWISSSRIFLRSVLRLTPRRSAARI